MISPQYWYRVQWSRYDRKNTKLYLCGVELALLPLTSHKKYIFGLSISFMLFWHHNEWCSTQREAYARFGIESFGYLILHGPILAGKIKLSSDQQKTVKTLAQISTVYNHILARTNKNCMIPRAISQSLPSHLYRSQYFTVAVFAYCWTHYGLR